MAAKCQHPDFREKEAQDKATKRQCAEIRERELLMLKRQCADVREREAQAMATKHQSAG